MTAFVRFAVLSVLLACSADGKPWDLESYELCRHERLADIPNEASGVTYSQVTNSLWVITRRPPAVFEYSLSGKKLRQVSHRGLRDPEGDASLPPSPAPLLPASSLVSVGIDTN